MYRTQNEVPFKHKEVSSPSDQNKNPKDQGVESERWA